MIKPPDGSKRIGSQRAAPTRNRRLSRRSLWQPNGDDGVDSADAAVRTPASGRGVETSAVGLSAIRPRQEPTTDDRLHASIIVDSFSGGFLSAQPEDNGNV